MVSANRMFIQSDSCGVHVCDGNVAYIAFIMNGLLFMLTLAWLLQTNTLCCPVSDPNDVDMANSGHSQTIGFFDSTAGYVFVW